MPGSIIAAAVFGLTSGTAAFAVTAFAINMVASAIIARVFAPDQPTINSSNAQNPGNPVTASPASSNKLPVVYGAAYVGGTVTDMSITADNQTVYYVIALSEVTNTENGGTGDTFSFGNIYWGGKRVTFDATDRTKVINLIDESTAAVDTSVNGKLYFYLYRNGSSTPTNTSLTAYQVMSDTNLTYKWDSTKQMSNCCFAIIKMQYSVTGNVRGLEPVRFQITNSRNAPGDCFYDYLTSERYGAAIPVANVDTTSLTALNTYSAQTVIYTSYSGASDAITRFRFDGAIDTSQPVMSNLQLMANSCDCLLKYNEITGQWGVIVQSPTYTVAMDLNDSNIISALSVTPLDLSNSFNIAEVKFPDGSMQDSFNTATFDLSVIAPSLMYPNEPVNKQSVVLQLVNNNVRAQLLANRFLKSGREDLQVQLRINYVGLQLEAGDIVSVTNANYGWAAKLFRVSKVVEEFGQDGSVTASLSLMEYNPTVYDDASVTQFTPAPNTGLPASNVFGNIPAPTITSSQPTAANPSFQVNVTSSSAGVIQYAEVWYSAFASPTDSQRIFAGTTAVQSNGNPYSPNTALPVVTLTGIPAGNWYFFTRMVNSLGNSAFSSASSVFQWRPTTFTYANQYLVVAYADSITGTGLSSSRTGKSYYGLYNSTTSSFSTNASDYTWYLAQPTFGTSYYLAYINRTGRTFSFATSTAGYASGTAAFVPTLPQYDQSLWSALPDGTNYIDLDVRTGQLIKTGTTTTGGGQIAITNNPDGTMVGALQQFLNFGGASTFTGTPASITVDIYGRVVALTPPDGFYYTSWETVATAGQTVFTPTARGTGYITGQDLVFRNGTLLDSSEYTETSTTITMGTACAAGDQVAVLSFRSVATSVYYEPLNIYFASGTTTVTYTGAPYQIINVGDKLTFSSSGTPTQYTVSAVNTTTKTITFTAAVSGVTAGTQIYRYRASGSTYPSFSRYTATLSAASSYTPTTFTLRSGYELLFLNGTVVNDQDYDLVSNTINNFPAVASGNLTIIQWAENSSTVPNGLPANVAVNTAAGQATYSFSFDPNYFEIYGNGLLYVRGASSDYNVGTNTYTLNPTPTTNLTVLVQETFNGAGPA